VRDAVERKQVVLAEAEHLDVADQHHLFVVGLEGRGQHLRRVHPQAREQLRVGPGHPGRGADQTIAVRVLTDRDEDFPDRLLDRLQVDRVLYRPPPELAVDQPGGEMIQLVLRSDVVGLG
jgi:hypothetical protein